MTKNYRQGRVSQEILREVNRILMFEIKDPRVQGVTLTEVDLTGDLQEATIYYSTLEEDQEDKEAVQAGLEKATGRIRKLLGENLTLYHTPQISFQRDPSMEYGNRIDTLLDQLHKDK